MVIEKMKQETFEKDLETILKTLYQVDAEVKKYLDTKQSHREVLGNKYKCNPSNGLLISIYNNHYIEGTTLYVK